MQTSHVPQRMAWVLAALAPAMLLLAILEGSAWGLRLAFALALGWAVDAVSQSLRRAPPQSWPGDASAPVTAVLVLLCLPPDVPIATLALGVVVAIALGKQVFGGLGENPFNPAMLGVALIALVLPAQVAAAPGSGWLSLALLLGGLVLLARRVIGWQAPLGVVAGVAIAAAGLAGSGSLPQAVADALALSWVPLAAFFVATDPVTGCAHARARLLFGFGAGALAFLLERFQPGGGLPCAILAMNFAAPWLDQRVAPARAGATR